MQRPRERLSGKAPNIGVLLDCMGDQYQAAVLRGKQDAAHHAAPQIPTVLVKKLAEVSALKGSRLLALIAWRAARSWRG